MVRLWVDGDSERVKLVGFENPADLPLPNAPSVDRLLARTPMRFDDPATGGPEVDVFALAALIYRVATGASPFAASDVKGLQQELLRLGPKRARSVRRELPAGLDLALSEALHRDPASRLTSVQGFRERLVDSQSTAGTRPMKAQEAPSARDTSQEPG